MDFSEIASRYSFFTAFLTPLEKYLLLCLSLSSNASKVPVDAPEGTDAIDVSLVDNHVAITTRVAPSFLRVGQLELFARRVRSN